jgi:hypothetical protein
MAFNPFHAFRKHQKVLLASVTLLAMVSFILCSGVVGSKDVLFDFFANLFGGKARIPQVTKLYGKAVNTAEVADLLRERRLAQDALGRALYLASQEIRAKAQKVGDPKETDPDVQREREELFQQQQALSPPQYFGPQFSMPPGAMWWRALAPFQDMDKLDNLLDFMVWRHQADKLGIDLTPESINRALKDLTFDYADLSKVFQSLHDSQTYGKLKVEDVQRALGDEFRVRIAQAAVLGYEPIQPDNPFASQLGQRPQPKPLVQVPGPVTPYEFRNRYIHLRTGIDVALVPVPVKPNEEKTLTEQDQREMRALYNLYKEREPVPDQSTPGFKVPRKLRVEWVEARVDDPYYQKSAPDWRKALYEVQRGPGGFVPQIGGGSLVPVLSQALFNSAFNVRELVAYNDLKTWNSPYKLPSWTDPGYVAGIYTTRARAEDVAGAVGQLMSAGATPGLPLGSLTAVTGYQAALVARNQKDKDFEAFASQEKARCARAGATMVLLGADPFPAAMLAVYAQEAAQSDRYLPYNVLGDQVTKAADTSLSKDVIVGSLKDFQKNLSDRRGTPAKARQWLDGDKSTDGAIKKYALHPGMMPEGTATDRYAIAKDKALAPLVEAYRRVLGSQDPKAENFPKLFFGPEPGLYRPGSIPNEQGWHDAEAVFLFWTVEDQKAYSPTYEQAKAQVEKAWKLQKARPVTKKEAEELLTKLEKTNGDLRNIRDLAAQARTDVITLPGYVVRQVPATKPAAVPTPARTYEGYKFPDSILYPRTSEWLDKILALKKKGDAVLLVNQPETTYYVAVALTDPDVPDDKKIAQAYGSGLFALDPLLSEMVQDRQKEHREQAIKELRAASGAPLNPADQTYEIPDDIRKQFAGKGASDVGE